MNVFMLGRTRGAGDNGNNLNTVGENRDAKIALELDRLVRAQVLQDDDATTGASWWKNGVGGPAGIGTLPAGVNARQYSAGRSLATNYVCAEAGCHNNTVMMNIQWGTSFMRADTGTGAQSAANLALTGHALPSVGTTSGSSNNAVCGPCHPGNPAGGYDGPRQTSRQAFGCDQCHDMVGVATNSTAFPHGNRNIQVWEWEASGVATQTQVSSGNLWMYYGNQQRKAGTSDNQPWNDPGSRFADPTLKVMTGVTNGSGAANGTTATGLRDGACLKCHLVQDAASLAALGARTGSGARWSGHGQNPVNPTTSHGYATGSPRMVLYK